MQRIEFGQARRTFAFGAYGTNNVGYEAIFEGVCQCIPGAIQIYTHKPCVEPSVGLHTLLRSTNRFRSDDRLIIGGGGVWEDEDAVKTQLDLATRVKAAGGMVEILGVGAEGADASYYDLIRELVDLAHRITVRSTMSQYFVQKITGRFAHWQNDFGSEISFSEPAPALVVSEIPQIGVVTCGNVDEDISGLARAIQHYTGPDAEGGRVHFVHIPHSRSYVSLQNNDVAVGHALWSSIAIDKENRPIFFDLEPFNVDPASVLERYASLDGVVTQRLHGMIFAQVVGIPSLTLNASSAKNRSFLEDSVLARRFAAYSQTDIMSSMEGFIDHVRRTKQLGSRLNRTTK